MKNTIVYCKVLDLFNIAYTKYIINNISEYKPNKKNIKTLVKIFTLILIFTSQFNTFAQKWSNTKAKKIFWVVNNDTITVDDAIRGIRNPEDLSINILFGKDTKNQRIEFKWYRRGATHDYLTNSFTKNIEIEKDKNETILVSSSRGNLKIGWWKVQVEAYIDRKPIMFENKMEFWILIK